MKNISSSTWVRTYSESYGTVQWGQDFGYGKLFGNPMQEQVLNI